MQLTSVIERYWQAKQRDLSPNTMRDYQLAGRMMGQLDVPSRLPVHLWYTDDEQAHDQRFWAEILPVLPPKTRLLLDLDSSTTRPTAS